MIIESYNKRLAGKFVNIVVEFTTNKEFPYYAISSLNVDSAGRTIVEAKRQCENATLLELKLNNRQIIK